jgi:hypothetical protein
MRGRVAEATTRRGTVRVSDASRGAALMQNVSGPLPRSERRPRRAMRLARASTRVTTCSAVWRRGGEVLGLQGDAAARRRGARVPRRQRLRRGVCPARLYRGEEPVNCVVGGCRGTSTASTSSARSAGSRRAGRRSWRSSSAGAGRPPPRCGASGLGRGARRGRRARTAVVSTALALLVSSRTARARGRGCLGATARGDGGRSRTCRGVGTRAIVARHDAFRRSGGAREILCRLRMSDGGRDLARFDGGLRRLR